MSYDISLKCPVTRETIELDSPHQMAGGTYALGGTKEAWLNITYNYADWYYADGVFPDRGVRKEDETKLRGIRSLYDLSGAESIPILENAIAKLKEIKSPITDEELATYKNGYWKPTRENALKPLYQLLAFAKLRPDGVWDGD